jgi:hypothetical protein
MKRKKDQLPIALLSLIGFFVLLTLVLMTLWLRSLSLIEYDSTAIVRGPRPENTSVTAFFCVENRKTRRKHQSAIKG